MFSELKKLRFMVIGASSGVGRRTTELLAEIGSQTVIASRSLDKVTELADKFNEHIHPLALNVDHEESCRSAMDTALTHLGGIDVLVNTSGVHAPRRSFSDLTQKDLENILRTNTVGVFNVLKAYHELMPSQKASHLIQVSSVAAQRPSTLAGCAYTASKHGIEGMIKTVSQEVMGSSLRISTVSPGPIDTPLVDTRPVKASNEDRQKMLSADSVAKSILFIASLEENVFVENMIMMPTGLPRRS